MKNQDPLQRFKFYLVGSIAYYFLTSPFAKPVKFKSTIFSDQNSLIQSLERRLLGIITMEAKSIVNKFLIIHKSATFYT